MIIENQQDYIDYRLQKADESFADALLRNQFGLHFIKTGKIDKRIGKHYSKLFDLRQKGDYGDLYDYDAVLVEPLIPLTREFVEEIKRLIVS